MGICHSRNDVEYSGTPQQQLHLEREVIELIPSQVVTTFASPLGINRLLT